MRVVRTTSRRFARLAGAAVLAVSVGAGTLVPAPATAAATTVWSQNLWVTSAFVTQDPYYTACVAASVMTMLNTVAYRRAGGPGFTWTPYRVRNNTSNTRDYRDMTSILSFARGRDTLRSSSPGTDAHGWRNALNGYGWGTGAMADPANRVYEDRAYSTMDAAVRAAVRAIARFGMPVGVLTWAGGHAQVMTGYEVIGEDPRVSDAFQVRAVWLSDPLRSASIVNRKIGLESLRSGSLAYRFQRYRETDSPHDDPYTTGSRRSSVAPTVGPSEWYHRWVIVLPVRAGLPAVDPAPDPTPTPEPPTATPLPSVSSPDPTPVDASPTPVTDPSPTASPVVSAEPAVTEAPASEPAATASPESPVPAASDPPAPSGDPSATPPAAP